MNLEQFNKAFALLGDDLFDIVVWAPNETPEEAEKRHGYAEGFAEGVHRNLEKDVDWGWCDLRVTLRLGRFNVSEYLSLCSYGSEDEFRADGYYDTMKADIVARCREMLA